ncbi:unnamed protein product [Auanema sp. JU1783]|nr:unnamed protein product [Auanema sp. JU1783]
MTEAKRAQKQWNVPNNLRPSPSLTLFNSLSRKKEVFVPNEGRIVKWYICGPTVYDSSHMGHARAYLSLDILRRVMTDYFGYDVQFIMNITDIDDKIIKRARQRHLLTNYVDGKQAPSVAEITSDVIASLEFFKVKFENEEDVDKKAMQAKMITKVESSASILEKALISGDQPSIESAKGRLLNDARDILSDWLDSKYGHEITDHSIFNNLAKTYENEFLADMHRLNVLPPDVLTRVSEYVPEVINYIQKIIQNNYAYATNDGSVYFDTEKFKANPKHFYAKLVPEAVVDHQGNKTLLDAEGELTSVSQGKKNNSDFALWKSSKPGEPLWDSPWGKGRPGWHIECSAMCSEICGEKLDIHAGGFDLKFPHHDNEIAQCEAHSDQSHWVNYFLHCGTLKIAGLKMSKSLKNFITIREALTSYTSRQLRLLFLMHNWTDVLDYSPSTMELAQNFEKVTNEFFLLVKDFLRRHYKPDSTSGFVKFNERELTLSNQFSRIKEEIHIALCDSVDTRTVVHKIRELVALGNAYIAEKETENVVPNCMLLKNIAAFITRLFEVFGIINTSRDIGFPIEGASGETGSHEGMIMPYLVTLSDFRENVRLIAKKEKITEILEECDRLRDEILPELGVRLEDRAGQTVVKLADRETLRKEQEQKKALEEQKKLEKEKKAAEREAKEAAKAAAKKVNPNDMFKTAEDQEKYSAWDEKGIPTHVKDGEEISKKLRKKLEKLHEQQCKVFLESNEKQ